MAGLNDIWREGCILSPSLICLDQCNLERQVRTLEDSGVGLLHVDILDGHFSPSMPLGLEAVRQLRARTGMPFDVHLMAENPEFFVDELLGMGVDQIVFQIESAPHVDMLLGRIHAAGVRAGVALKPSTPLSALDYVLERCDAVLLMLINPGYASSAGESQGPYAERKIREARALIDARHPQTKLEIDGRVSPADIRRYGGGTVDVFVAGSTCLNKADLAGSCSDLLALRERVCPGTKE